MPGRKEKPVTAVPDLPRAELIQFEAADGVVLPGLLYHAPGSRTVAVYLHGNGDASVFYAQRTNPLAAAFVARGIAFFPFNNRGAHLVKKLTKAGSRSRKSVNAGTAFERIRECIHDVDGAIAVLRRRGYRHIVLIGHSSGANKICVYNYYRRRNLVSAYVLLGPGDDMGLYLEQWGSRRFGSMLQRAKREIRAGRRLGFAPETLTPFPISWMSLYDTINPEGDYNIFPFLEVMRGFRLSRKSPFREFRALRKPTLTVVGEHDEFCFGDPERCLEILEEQVPGRSLHSFRLLRGADHGFHGSEKELAELIIDWIHRLLPGTFRDLGGAPAQADGPGTASNRGASSLRKNYPGRATSQTRSASRKSSGTAGTAARRRR